MVVVFLVSIQRMIWRVKNHELDLRDHALIMGIVNVTLDSFSDGGKFADANRAVAHALAMARDGAEIIDIGGESTRPGAEPVSEDEEMRRVLPVVERMKAEGGRMKTDAEKVHSSSFILHPLLSIDTCKPAVAEAAIVRGASIINDVTGLRDDAMLAVAARTGAGVIAMHMQGTPQTMQRAPQYDDVVREVCEFFQKTFERAVTAGVAPECIAFDPGFGFGKTLEHNLALLKNFASLRVADRPLVAGVSRKSFIGKIIGSEKIEDRDAPTIALTALLRERGANIIRVHDVKPNADALRVAESILK
jgi:dihydropteroate synthase